MTLPDSVTGRGYPDSQVPTPTVTKSTETWASLGKVEISTFGKNVSYAPLCHHNAQTGKNTTATTFSFLQLENYIVENMKSEMVQLQQNAVQNHTATMLEIGTSLLSQTAEQTRKLTDVETQVCSQSGFLKAVNCRELFPFSFFSDASPHKTFQHRAPRNIHSVFISANSGDEWPLLCVFLLISFG